VKRLTQFLMSLVIAGFILYVVFGRFDLRQGMAAARQAHASVLGLGFALMVAAYLVRGARWRIWERSLSYWDALRLILIGFMGNNVLPARLGEVLRAHCAASKAGENRGRTSLLASIAAERILDGVLLSAFCLVGITLVPLDGNLRKALLLVSLVFAGLAAGLILGIRCKEQIHSATVAANRRFPCRLTTFARHKADHFLEGLLHLGTLTRMLAALAITAIIWSLEIGFYYCLGRAVSSNLTLPVAILFLVVVNFASIVPFTMGGIGTIEAIAPVFLISAGIPSDPALVMVLMQHAAQFLFTTATGGVLYFAGGFYRIPLASAKAATPAQPSPQPSPVLQALHLSLAQLGESIALKPPLPRGETLLSIVIPAYNEQARLPRTVLETIHWGTMRDIDFEIIIADDGSTDHTLDGARLFEESDARVRVLACPHLGKGAAVRMGMLNAKGRFVLFMDADGATPLDEMPKLLAALEQGHDLAIGSRVVRHPGEVEVKTSPLRRLVGRSFALFANLLAVEGVRDTQCGFKMFRREAVAEIFARQKIAGFAFDVEVLFLARRLGLSIAEIPVNWVAQPGSKVNLVTDSIKMLWDISRIRWLHRKFTGKPVLRFLRSGLTANNAIEP